MLTAGFDAKETQECDPAYLNFMACAIVAEAKRYERLVACLPNSNILPQLNFMDRFEIIEGPKMGIATNYFRIESSCLLKRCMLAVGFQSSETQECDPVYLHFMAQAISVETQRHERLSQILRRARKMNSFVKRSGCEKPKASKKHKSRCLEASSSKKVEGRGNAFFSLCTRKDVKFVNLSSEAIGKALLISESKNAEIYCIPYLHGKAAVKVLKNQAENNSHSKRLLSEHKITEGIPHPGIRRAIAGTYFKGKEALLLEWFDGKTVKDIGKLTIKRFLVIAREIVSTMVALHEHGVMHKNINTENIMVDLETATVKIIGNSICSRFYEKNESLGNLERLQGDLHFISPEDTGRMNRTIDFRSDFYSLGIVFYFMLAGQLPLISDNPSQLIHKHIFQDPPTLKCVHSLIPSPISDMVAKLMAKNAEDRYQAAKGLLFDLDMMVSEYDSDHALCSIVLAQRDFTEKLLVSQKLYDRSSQLSEMLSAFERVSQGSFEIVFVRGKSGTGKSSLVLELYKPVTQEKGYFVTGKHDLSQKNKPYSALLKALQNFCGLLLTETSTTLSEYRSLIQQAVGEEGKLLTEWISNLHLIIGEQKPLAFAVGQNAKNRFNYVLCKFIGVICSRLHPLVIFLEDLQWVDQDSLNFLSMLVSDKSIKYLLVIGTYRSEEVNDSHPLIGTLQEMKKKAIINEIEVLNLSKESVNDLISDALHTPQLDTFPLTALILEKTHGNPFFVIHALRSLSDEKLLYFSYENNKWNWDLNKFDTNSIAESVFELITEEILKLNRTAQDVLKMASCLESHFSISTLSLLTDDTHAIQQTMSKGMIVSNSKDSKLYRFAHDQIQLAAYLLIPKEERKSTHYRIGKLLWKKSFTKEKNDNLFILVNLLNSARAIINEPQERIEIARLNLQASKIAKSSTAFKLALEYVMSGIEFLSSNHWSSHYDLSLQLYNAAAEAAYCYKDYSCMVNNVLQIRKNASCMLHKVQSFSIQIRSYNDKRMHEEAVSTALNVLGKLGEQIPAHPTAAWIKEKLYEIKVMKTLTSENLVVMPIMEDETALASMQILSDITLSCFFSNPSFLPVVGLQMVKITLAHGVSKFSACGFALLGLSLYNMEDNKEGYRFCELSLLLLKQIPSKEFLPRIYILIYGGCLHWSKPIHLTLEPLLHSYWVGLEAGANDLSLISANLYLTHAICCGKSLQDLLHHVTMFYKQFEVKPMALVCNKQTILSLIGDDSENSKFLKWDKVDISSFDDERIPAGERARGLFFSYIIAYFFHEYELASKWANQCRLLSGYLNCIFPVHVFYDGMIAISMAKLTKDESKWKTIANEVISKIRKFSLNSPGNFQHNLKLLEAELASLNKDETETIQLYNDAITLARLHNFINIEALACERAGIFCIEHCENMATNFLSRSYQAYSQWGATAKMRHLMNLFPKYIMRRTCEVPFISFSIPMDTNSCIHSTSSVSELTEV